MFRNSYIRILEYAVTSVSTFAIDIALIWVMVQFLHLYYIWAVILGYIIAVTLAYFANRDLTFKGTRMKFTEGYLRTLFIAVLCFLIVIFLMYFFVEFLGVNYILARLLIGLFNGVLGYILEAVFAFKMPLLYNHKKI